MQGLERILVGEPATIASSLERMMIAQIVRVEDGMND